MKSENNTVDRLGLIATLARRSPTERIGRTALMKFCYLLQVIKGVPLGYSFTLYSYGPFDSDVLSDLNTAETVGIVDSDVVYYSGGYGYEIKEGKLAEKFRQAAKPFLSEYKDSIDWVVDTFGSLGSAELELISTTVFVDRETHSKGAHLSLRELADAVGDIKPRFSKQHIEQRATWLNDQKLLRSLQKR